MSFKECGLKTVSMLLCLLLVFAAMVPFCAVAETERKVVRVGYDNVKGYEEGTEGTRKTGFGYEYLQRVSYYTGWKYEYVYAPFAELLTMLRNGEIDLMGDVSYMPEREPYMNFSEYAQGSEKYFLFTTRDRKELADGSAEALRGKKIGVVADTYQATLLREWADENNTDSVILEYPSNDGVAIALKTKQVDMIVLPDFAEEWGFMPIRIIGSKEFYFALAKQRTDLLAEINDAMRQIQTAQPNYNEIVENKYSKNAVGAACLTADEQAWLENHGGTVSIGFVDDQLPYSSLQANGKVHGYLEALIYGLEKRLDIKVIPKAYRDLQSLYIGLTSGEVDAIGPCVSDFYLCECSEVMNTDAITETQIMVIYKHDNICRDVIAVSGDNLIEEPVVQLMYPDSESIRCEDMRECLRKVQSGEADCMLIAASMLDKLRGYSEFSALSCSDTGKRLEVSMITSRGNIDLLTILNKAITLSSDKLNGSAYIRSSETEHTDGIFALIGEKIDIVHVIIAAVFVIILLLLITYFASYRKICRRNRVLRERQEELESELSSLKKENRSNILFLSNMSHDVREPMNSILGFIRLLRKNGNHPPEEEEQLNKIERSGMYMLNIIDTVLDMSRLASGQTVLDENVMDVSDKDEHVSSIFAGEMKRKNINFIHELDVKHPYVFADEARISQVFIRLLGNAVKFTPEGGTIRMVTKEITSDREGIAVFQTDIIDNGIGMSPQFLEHIYDSFARERDSSETEIVNNGLGLFTAKKLIDLMDGTIEVESELGKGTSFRVTIPQRIAEEPKAYILENRNARTNAKNLKGKRILVAEDNELNAEIALAVLKDLGMKTEWAKDGVACVDLIMKNNADYFDAVLMDIRMPNLDGYKATEKIRRVTDKTKASIPIIAMTANTRSEDRKKAFEAGMNGYLTKPVDVEHLVDELTECLK